MLVPVFTSAQITTIAANVAGTGFQSQDVVAQGMKSYRFTNLTGCALYLYDDGNRLLEAMPGNTAGTGRLRNPTRTLNVQFDPARSGGSGAFSSNTAWQLYVEAIPEELEPDIRGQF